MVKTESGCVNCGLPCIGKACPYHTVEIHYCDECDEELDDIYEVDGDELCEYCLKKRFLKDGC